MSKKVAQTISILELIIGIIIYFSIAYHFDSDKHMLNILSNTDFKATLFRLSIYIIPSLNIISALFGIVFSTRGILIFSGILEILAGIFTMSIKGKSDYMYVMSIIMICLGVIYIITIIINEILKKHK